MRYLNETRKTGGPFAPCRKGTGGWCKIGVFRILRNDLAYVFIDPVRTKGKEGEVVVGGGGYKPNVRLMEEVLPSHPLK